MKKLIILSIILLAANALQGQISVTFTGTGAATRVDSVTATNLTTNLRVTLPGNETLVLTAHTGIPTVAELSNVGTVYPNPFSGRATFITIEEKPQTVYLSIQNLVGQVVAQTSASVQAGENEFNLSLSTAGIYMVSLTSVEGTSSYKVICTDASESENSIQYLGTIADNQTSFSRSVLKSSPTTYTLGYTSGEIILYKCFSGIYTTIVTDSLISSKNYRVEFVPCTDPDGRNNAVVHVGDQTWIAENLAWLPFVSPSSSESENSPYYYVYGYEGSSVSAVKATTNYSTYRVLYNWEAAKIACPSGWHLPSDGEWTILTDYLTNNGYGYGGSGSDIGKSMASASGWTAYFLYAGTIGNDQGSNNHSGFTALPGGYRTYYGGFDNLGTSAGFWSSSEDVALAWYWGLGSRSGDVHRVNYSRGPGFSVRCLQN